VGAPSEVAVDDVRFEGGVEALAPVTPPAPHTVATVNAAYGGTVVAPESIASGYGKDLATTTAQSSAPIPSTLGGTTVKVKDAAGVERPASIFYVSPTQVNFAIPAGTAPGQPRRSRSRARAHRLPGTGEPWARSAPGVFSANGDGKGVAAANLLRVRANGTRSDEAVAQLQGGTFVPLPIDLGAAAGDQVYLILYGTGVRGHAGPVSVEIAGTGVSVLYAGPQGELHGPRSDQRAHPGQPRREGARRRGRHRRRREGRTR